MIVTLILMLSTAASVRGAVDNPTMLDSFDTKGHCYKRLNCFPGGPPYYGTKERPYGFLPFSPDVMDVRYLLYTRKNPKQFQVIRAIDINLTHNDTQLKATNFDPNRPTVMIIHGFGEKGNNDWLVEMCQAILNVTDVNCFCVDWHNGSFTLYTQAAANLRVVGAEIANFLNFLKVKYNYFMDNVTLIGHSLGGHVLCEAGKRQQGIGLMVGLDPAGPYFEHAPTSVRLNPTNARLVVAIHTDAPPEGVNISIGMKRPLGHYDIYVNGGHNMPGCKKFLFDPESIYTLYPGFDESQLCNHYMDFQYFTKSILRPDGLIAYPAASYKDFQKGAGFPCTNGSCLYLGFKVKEYAKSHGQNATTRQTFYMNTGDSSNILRWRYNISIAINGEELSEGSLSASLCGEVGCSNYSQIYSGPLKSGESYSSLIDVELDVNPIRKMQFIWEKSLLSSSSCKMGATTITVQSGSTGEKNRFCGCELTEEKKTQILDKCSSN